MSFIGIALTVFLPLYRLVTVFDMHYMVYIISLVVFIVTTRPSRLPSAAFCTQYCRCYLYYASTVVVLLVEVGVYDVCHYDLFGTLDPWWYRGYEPSSLKFILFIDDVVHESLLDIFDDFCKLWDHHCDLVHLLLSPFLFSILSFALYIVVMRTCPLLAPIAGDVVLKTLVRRLKSVVNGSIIVPSHGIFQSRVLEIVSYNWVNGILLWRFSEFVWSSLWIFFDVIFHASAAMRIFGVFGVVHYFVWLWFYRMATSSLLFYCRILLFVVLHMSNVRFIELNLVRFCCIHRPVAFRVLYVSSFALQ